MKVCDPSVQHLTVINSKTAVVKQLYIYEMLLNMWFPKNVYNTFLCYDWPKCLILKWIKSGVDLAIYSLHIYTYLVQIFLELNSTVELLHSFECCMNERLSRTPYQLKEEAKETQQIQQKPFTWCHLEGDAIFSIVQTRLWGVEVKLYYPD